MLIEANLLVGLAADGSVYRSGARGVGPGSDVFNCWLKATYGLIGVLLGSIFGRVNGVFMAFLIPFLDLGIGQSPMLRGEPASWARYLPGYGSTRMLIDGALTGGFDEPSSLLIASAWSAGLVLAAVVLFRRTAFR